MFGSHLSVAGGMHNALIEARRLGFESVQVFTKNQRQWSPPPLSQKVIDEWKAHLAQTGIRQPVSHASYLINLAATNPQTRKQSIDTFVEELTRCQRLDIGLLVLHPGAHLGAGEEQGIAAIAQAIDEAHARLPDCPVLTCLEITAGQGTCVGHELWHLRKIIEQCQAAKRMAVCIDTAHALAAGYDLTGAAGAKDFLKQMDDELGLDRIKAMHINDSKTARGSRVDRHQHLGLGHVNMEAVGVLIRNDHLRTIPKILETPKETHDSGRDWDSVNLELLRKMMEG